MTAGKKSWGWGGCIKTHANSLLLHVAEAEKFVELFPSAIGHDFLPRPDQAVDNVHDDRGCILEASGFDRDDVFVRHALFMF